MMEFPGLRLEITLQAVTAERNLSYEREAPASLDAVDRGAAHHSRGSHAAKIHFFQRTGPSGWAQSRPSQSSFPFDSTLRTTLALETSANGHFAPCVCVDPLRPPD